MVLGIKDQLEATERELKLVTGEFKDWQSRVRVGLLLAALPSTGCQQFIRVHVAIYEHWNVNLSTDLRLCFSTHLLRL